MGDQPTEEQAITFAMLIDNRFDRGLFLHLWRQRKPNAWQEAFEAWAKAEAPVRARELHKGSKVLLENVAVRLSNGELETLLNALPTTNENDALRKKLATAKGQVSPLEINKTRLADAASVDELFKHPFLPAGSAVRLRRFCKENNITTIGALRDTSQNQFLRSVNFGMKSIRLLMSLI